MPRAIACSIPALERKKPSAVRSPVRNSWSRSSASEISMSAASASVRATISVGTPQTSAASRAATRLRIAHEVGSSTLPPMCPHFFSDASWSSRCTPAAPASIIALVELEDVQVAAEAGLHVGDDRDHPVDLVVAVGVVDLVGAQQRAVDRAHDLGDAVDRVQALVGVHLAREVGVGRDLPAATGRSPPGRPGPAGRPGCRCWRRARRRTAGRAAGSRASRRRCARACARSHVPRSFSTSSSS